MELTSKDWVLFIIVIIQFRWSFPKPKECMFGIPKAESTLTFYPLTLPSIKVVLYNLMHMLCRTLSSKDH